VGNHHAKQLFRLPVWNKRWWQEVFFELRWYMFLEKEPKKYVGHNPLAQTAMFGFMTVGMTFMIVTGFCALFGEGLGLRVMGGSRCSPRMHQRLWAAARRCTACISWACGRSSSS
jgi:Ni,Fe-hydrogenase I cytochrome b subunit